MSIEILNGQNNQTESGLINIDAVREVKIEDGVEIVYLNSAPEPEKEGIAQKSQE